jgi:hypothetical protein
VTLFKTVRQGGLPVKNQIRLLYRRADRVWVGMTLFKTVRAGQGGQLKTKYVYYTDDLSNFEKAKAIW